MNKERIAKFRKKLRWLGWYFPFLGAGVRLAHVNEEMTEIVVEMPLRWYNKNLFGTHFGGSLYSMCDPFLVIILFVHLGEDFLVWDKSAKIDFRKPGKGVVKARFEIEAARLETIREEVTAANKKTYFFKVSVCDASGEVVAEIEKEIYIRKKKKKEA